MRRGSAGVGRFHPRGAAVCLALAGALAFGARVGRAGEPSLADVAGAARRATLDIVTRGRVTGNPRTQTVWFVYDQGVIYVQSGSGGKTDWYRNLLKNPAVTLRIGALVLEGEARPVKDERLVEQVHDLFRGKYRLARIAQSLGSTIGRGEVVAVRVKPSP